MVTRRRRVSAIVATAVFTTVATISIGGCTIVGEPKWPDPVPDAELDRTFTKSDLAEDLADARAFIELVHPAPYERAPKERIDAAQAAAVAGVDRPLSRREFAPRMMRFLAAFEDGHTSGGFPSEDLWRFAKTGGRFVPFDAVVDGDAVRVDPVYEPVKDLAPGDRLLALDGRPIDAWIAQLAETQSGPPELARAQATRDLKSLLWCEGARTPIDVAWEKADGRRVERSLQGVIWHNRGEGVARANPSFEFRVLDGGVGLIDYRGMNDADAWQAFLERTFTRLRDERLRGLVVDLRQNGGGNSTRGVELLEYLTDRPYKMAARKEWKMSAAYRDFMKARVHPAIRWLPLQWFHPLGRKMWGADEGEIVTFDSESMQPAPDADVPLRFHGPCVFLIGPRTFSSALMLADAVKTFSLATTMGEETAECPTGFGEVMPHVVPHTRLQFQVSSARWVRASGDLRDRRGVVPQIEVKESSEDLARGVDTALEAARRFVLDASLSAPPASAPARGRD